MNNLSDIKHSHNIVDVIGQYITLKKSGHNHFGCCPFHAEKTASFTVDEKKQFYHCFGCGAHGDAIAFLCEYSGLDFVDACKSLGAEAELMPSEKVIKNLRDSQKIIRDNVPADHKQDGDLASKYLSKCRVENIGGVDFHRYKTGFMLPIYTADYELVNAVNFSDGKQKNFIAGGVSYNGFTPIRKNDSSNFMACVTLADGRFIANNHNVNVAVCWTDGVMKYLCKWNYGELKIKPVITSQDDDYLCYEMPWLKFDDYKLEKMKCMN